MNEPAHPAAEYVPTASLIALFASHGITARASIREQTLHLGITVNAADGDDSGERSITAQIYRLLSEIDPEAYALNSVAIVRLYGLKNGKQTLWKQMFPMPNLQPTEDDKDLYSFNNRFSNMVLFPGLLLIAALLNAAPAVQLLLFGINIWIQIGRAHV